MSSFFGSSFLGLPITVDTPDADAPPEAGQQFGQQASYALGGLGFGGYGFGGGWTTGNPAFTGGQDGSGGFGGCNSFSEGIFTTGYPLAMPGTYANYRLLMMHAAITLARNYVFDSIIAATSDWDIDDDAPAELAAFVKKNFPPTLIDEFIRQMVRGMDYGWSASEMIWEVDDDNKWVLKRFKALLVDYNVILIDEFGNFAGIRASGISSGQGKYVAGFAGDLPPNKVAIWSYDAEAGNIYGRSRLENPRVHISRYWHTDDHIERLSKKASGTILVVKTPPGGTKDPITGKEETWFSFANRFAKKVLNSAVGSGFLICENTIGFKLGENLTAQMKADAIAAMSKASFWDVSVLDLGDNGPAIAALLGVQSYRDIAIMRAYGVPERVLMEASKGGMGQSDSGNHTDTATANLQNIRMDMFKAFNEQCVAPCLEWNFGKKFRTVARAKPQPMDDAQESIDRDIMRTLAGGGQSALIYNRYDMDSVFTRNGIAQRVDPLDPKDMAQTAPTAAPGQKPEEDANDLAKGKLNGNGRMKEANNGNGNGN